MYFDLYTRARTDGEFKSHLEKLISAFMLAAGKAATSSKAKEEANQLLYDIWRYCGRNMFFMVGHYFPKFPQGKRLSFLDYPFVWSMLNFQMPFSLTNSFS